MVFANRPNITSVFRRNQYWFLRTSEAYKNNIKESIVVTTNVIKRNTYLDTTFNRTTAMNFIYVRHVDPPRRVKRLHLVNGEIDSDKALRLCWRRTRNVASNTVMEYPDYFILWKTPGGLRITTSNPVSAYYCRKQRGQWLRVLYQGKIYGVFDERGHFFYKESLLFTQFMSMETSNNDYIPAIAPILPQRNNAMPKDVA